MTKLSVKQSIILIVLVLIACSVFYMTYHSRGNWDFIVPFRGKKLLVLLIAAYAVGVSTLLFQTLTQNTILTPSILGFDALYLLLQSLLVFVLGTIGFSQINEYLKFCCEVALMIGGSLLLFRLLSRNSPVIDLNRMILVGVIFGVLFRSLNQLLQRLLDPIQFAVLQGQMFAQFNQAKEPMLWIALGMTILSTVFIWRLRYALDIIMLGKETAVNLGIEYRRMTLFILIWVAVLLATVTALVGPVSFFGLLVCALTNLLSPTMHHSIRLIIVFLLGAITLILGQSIFEYLLGMKAVLSIVVEFLGGIIFLFLIIRSKT